MMYQVAKVFSDDGKHVLIDGILVERPELQPHYARVQEVFAGYPFDIVEVYCPLEICRQRNLDRGDRSEEQSEEQSKRMAADIRYSYKVDTSISTPEECAEQIIANFFKTSLK